jgi:hypothetical protein
MWYPGIENISLGFYDIDENTKNDEEQTEA